MMYWNGMGAWGWIGMSVGMIVFWGLIIAGVVLLVRVVARSAGPHAAAASPQQILAERYARGEIADEEYQQRLATLNVTAAPTADR